MSAPQQIDWLSEASSRSATHPPRARRLDPPTSHAAAARADQFVAGHEAKCYAAICDAGVRGATYREIAAATGMEPVAVARRLGDMERRRLVTRVWNAGAPGESTNLCKRNGCAIWRACR